MNYFFMNGNGFLWHFVNRVQIDLRENVRQRFDKQKYLNGIL